LTPGFSRCGDAACDERGECTAIDHDQPRKESFQIAENAATRFTMLPIAIGAMEA